MGDVTSQDRAALEAARAAQEAARKAAAERARLLELQRQKQAQASQEAQAAATGGQGAQAVVDRDTFTKEVRIPGAADGADEADLQALFDQYDTDGVAGLSEGEFQEAYAAASAGQPAEARGEVSEKVQEEIDNALKDDKNTAEDLRDAADDVKTAEDVHALLAAAEATGQDEEALLRELLKGQDEDADEPNTAVFEAIAQHYERLGGPDVAAAVRVAGSPDVSKDVREKLVHALQDGKKTEKDLMKAAKAARTPGDLAAVMATQQATGAADPHRLLQETLKGLDENAEVPNSALLEAVADEWEALGRPELAEAARRAADPTLSRGVRKELIHALQDDKDTAEDIKDALEKAGTETETAASEVTGDATIGEAHTDQLAAVAEVKDAQEAYDDALKAVEEQNKTLQQAMGQMQGMPPEEQAAFVAEFKSRHPEYAAVDAAKANLAQAVASNQDAIAAALQRGDQLAEVDAGALEKALVVASEDPAGLEAAKNIATQIVENAANVPEERLELLTEQVLPTVFQAEVERALAKHGGDAVAAMNEVESSRLFKALETIDAVGGIKSKVEKFVEGYQELSKAIREGKPDAAAAVVADAADDANVSKLGVGLAGVGLVLGAVAFKDASGFAEKTQAALGTASAGADILEAAGKTFGRLGSKLPPNAFKFAGPVLGVVAGAISGFQNLKDGKYVEAAFDGASVALGVLAMTTAIPGLGIAAGILAGGIFVYQAWKGHQEQERRTDEIKDVMADIGIEPGLADFLTNSDPGAYDKCKEELGLSDDEIRALVQEGSPWTRQLDDFATPAFKENVLPTLAPDGDLKAALDRLGEGLEPDGVEWVADMLANLSVPMPDGAGRPMSIEDRLTQLMMTFPVPYDTEGMQARIKAEQNLRAALGIA